MKVIVHLRAIPKPILSKPVGEFSFDLPLPPSVNELYEVRTFKGKSGRGITPVYKRWRDAAAILLMMEWRRAGRPIIDGRWGFVFRLGINRQSDITNRVKAAEDLLVKAKITPGDQWMDDGRVVRDLGVPESLIRIRVFTLE